jgi:predicted glycosyltransferase
MRILVDIMHPAHVHFFRNAIRLWEKDHEVLVTSRDKEMTLDLLDRYGIENTCISRQASGLAGLFAELVKRDLRLYGIARKFKPDVLTGIAGVSVAHVGKVIGKPSVVFYDTETATLSNAITYPAASAICTPDCYMGDLGRKHVRYAGYHELAYLHPKRFTPDRSVLDGLGLGDGKFFILRFVSWQASHDIPQKGLSPENKMKLLDLLKAKGRVFISSEAPLPPELEPYRLSAVPEKMHDLMAFSSMVIGEGATVASEAAMLGVPALYITKPGRGLGYTNELEEKYGLIYNFGIEQYEAALGKVEELLGKPDLADEWSSKHSRMLSDKIDVTEFVKRFVEIYPADPEEAKRLPENIT